MILNERAVTHLIRSIPEELCRKLLEKGQADAIDNLMTFTEEGVHDAEVCLDNN